jgi:uncharacterized membrane protein
MVKRGSAVVSRDLMYKGKTTGGKYRCQMSGCTGTRIGVRWSDGTMTFPCSKGLEVMTNGEVKVV